MRIVVVGGGVGGLATAFRLRQAQPHAAITILEAGDAWGGVIRTTRERGCLLEHGPDSILSAKPAGMRLLADLGLDERLVTTRPEARRSLIARGTRLLPVPEGFYLLAPGRWRAFLASPLVSPLGKLRMALDLVLPRRAPDAPEESLAQFVRRRLGREALARLAQPLVAGITTADPERLSVAAVFPQLLEMERDHRSLLLAMRARQAQAPAAGARYGLFVTLAEGLGGLIEALVARLAGCDLRLGAVVSALVRRGDGWTVALGTGAIEADRVVLALPAHAARALVAPVDAALGERLAAVPYAHLAVVNLVYPRAACPLPEAAGAVIPAIERRRLIALSFPDRKFPLRGAADATVLRAFIGGAGRDAEADQPPATLIATARAEIAALLGVTAEPLAATARTWRHAMPQYELGHRERLAWLRAREAGIGSLALIGNGYEGVGIPDLCAQAEALAARWTT